MLERETGIEPATNGLGSRYSTIELLPLNINRFRVPPWRIAGNDATAIRLVRR
jgi:hypothetical protein